MEGSLLLNTVSHGLHRCHVQAHKDGLWGLVREGLAGI